MMSEIFIKLKRPIHTTSTKKNLKYMRYQGYFNLKIK